ncbi:MAG: ATP-binding protein [Bacilli bacterium]|nr:ATP-binding protein [Bacilli bacterium]
MQIAVLSGKGGTGKTLLSVNLSHVAKNSIYVDCDVEEPNGLLYYKIPEPENEPVLSTYPVIDHKACIGCQKCSNFCKFNALAYILDKVRVFKELCHSCGGCELVCPTNAISEAEKELGWIRRGEFRGTEIYSGEMKIGEESGVPIIKKLLQKIEGEQKDIFIDSPPGNGCSVMESISKADYCVLVAEPSIFGLHNLRMVYELTQKFKKRVGLVINKASEDPIIHQFAEENGIKILSEIPMDITFGEINSVGEFVSDQPKYKPIFESILSKIREVDEI